MPIAHTDSAMCLRSPLFLSENCQGFPGIAGLSSCPSSCRNITPGFCILAFEGAFAVPHLSSSGLFSGGPCRRRIRSTVEVLMRNRNPLLLWGSRLVLDSLFHHVLV